MNREAFEKVFPVPEGVWWEPQRQRYAPAPHGASRHGLLWERAKDHSERLKVWQAAKTDSAAQVEAIKEQCAVLCETECAQNDGITCAESIREMRIEP